MSSSVFPFYSWASVVGQGASDRYGITRSLPALHYRHFLVIIIIIITPLLSKAFNRQVSDRLERFMERSGVLPPTKFADWKDIGTSHASLCAFHTLQSALKPCA